MIKIVCSVDLRRSNSFFCIGLEFDNSLGSDVDVVDEVFHTTFDFFWRMASCLSSTCSLFDVWIGLGS